MTSKFENGKPGVAWKIETLALGSKSTIIAKNNLSETKISVKNAFDALHYMVGKSFFPARFLQWWWRKKPFHFKKLAIKINVQKRSKYSIFIMHCWANVAFLISPSKQEPAIIFLQYFDWNFAEKNHEVFMHFKVKTKFLISIILNNKNSI